MEGGGSLHPATRETVDKKMHYVYQDGKNVFKNAINGMTDISLEVLKKWISPEELKLLVPHQANFRIIDSVAKKLNLKPEQVFVNINKYGNTTAATIPMALSEACRENRIAREDWVLITAFGAGFAWGSLLMKWSME
jgi:3-oxoacyl-[acyl-carrier-protein] synthase-3